MTTASNNNFVDSDKVSIYASISDGKNPLASGIEINLNSLTGIIVSTTGMDSKERLCKFAGLELCDTSKQKD
jgi:hypothetical protein